MYVELNTERLLIKPLSIDNLVTAYEYASDIENTKYMLHLPVKKIEETKQFLIRVNEEWQKNSPIFFEYAIILDCIHIGAISVSLNGDRTEGELGWIINKKYWGNGYATEAASAVKEFAINNLGVVKLVAHCDARNRPSSNVMKKIGMTLEDDKLIRHYINSG